MIDPSNIVAWIQICPIPWHKYITDQSVQHCDMDTDSTNIVAQILQKLIGDPTFTYPIFEPEELHYLLQDNKLKNNMFPIKHVK